MNLYTQIRELVSQYANRVITLQVFREQFVLLYRNGIRFDQQTADLSKAVEVLYGDLMSREIDEQQFMKKLLAIPAGFSKSRTAAAGKFTFQFFQFTPLGASTTVNASGSAQELVNPDPEPELQPA